MSAPPLTPRPSCSSSSALLAGPPTSLAGLVRSQSGERPHEAFLQRAENGRAVSFGELESLVAAARDLLDGRVGAGAPVVVALGDPLGFAVVLLAVVACGRRAVPVDPSAPVGELARLARALEPGLLLTDRTDDLSAAGVPVVRTGLDELAARRPGAPAGRPRIAGLGRPAGAVVLHTSGSTGEPKSVELDERRLLHVAHAVATHNRLVPGDRGYNALPLFHINAEVVAVLASLVAGSTIVLSPRFHRTGFWTTLRELEITWLNAVPAMLAILAAEPAPPLPRLRFVRSASAPLLPGTRGRIEAIVTAPIIESYGMTEAASQITATPLDGSAPAGSAGRPVGVELQVRDGRGAPAATGEVGQVWIRGAGVVTSYGGGRAAERFDADHWLQTGDLGHLDTAGFLHLVGRSDDVINRGGEMVHPREIEEVLLADRRVREAVVVAGPHEILGEVPVGYVVPRYGATGLDSLVADLHQACAEHLSRAKRPTDLVVVDDLPRAATGKILRRAVRDELSATCA